MQSALADSSNNRCSASPVSRLTLTSPRPIAASLSQGQLDSIVAAATDRWLATGLTPQQVATLHSIKFDIGDLSGAYLGEADGDRILVDRNAEGKGWFVDASPLSDANFVHAKSATRLYTDPTSAPAGHVDLLTAIMHEMGHKLGLEDSYSANDRDNLMYDYLTVGERRIPSKGQAASATPNHSVAAHFLSLVPSVETPISTERAAAPPDVRKVSDLPTTQSLDSSGLRPDIGAQPQTVEARLTVGQSRHRTSDGRAADWGSSTRVSKGTEPQSGAMFIARERKNDSKLRRSEMSPATEANIALLQSAGNNLDRVVYQHSVPTGLKDRRSEVRGQRSEVRDQRSAGRTMHRT